MSYVEIVGASAGTPPSVLLVTNTKRYLFNAGEGLQRFCMANRVRLTKLTDIFLTQLGIGQYGGVPGLYLTLSDVMCGQMPDGRPACSQISIYGPVGVQTVVEATRLFASHPVIALQAQELAETRTGIFTDANVRIDAIVLRTPSQSYCPRKRSREMEAIMGLDPVRTCRTAEDEAPALCYLIHMAHTVGKFNAARAQALGVPRGPECARLVAGHTVTLPDGRLIEPSQVVGPARPGAAFAVITCPTPAHMASLSAARFETDAVVVVVHLTPPSLAQSAAYVAWVRACWPAGVTHLYADDGAHLHPSTYRCSAAQQYALHCICSETFTSCPRPLQSDCTPPRSRYVLPPHKTPGLDLSHIEPEPDFHQIRTFIKSVAGLSPLQATLPETSSKSGELLFLGTGAAAPSKYRNSSGISWTLPMEERPHILLDCGEGVLGQLYRVYSDEDRLNQYLLSLRLVWISHHHADHHVGLLSLIRARSRLMKESDHDLIIVAPARVLTWIRTFADHGCDYLRCRLAHNHDESGAVRAWVQHALGLTRFDSIPVIHCAESFGLVLEMGSADFKLVYSGDTRPSPALIEAGRGATVLIHEATFEDELGEEAIVKKHSTTR